MAYPQDVVTVNIDSLMLAHILSYIYTKRYSDAEHFPRGTPEWLYHWLIKQAAESWGLTDLVKEAELKCSDGHSLISNAEDAYTAIVWLHSKGDVFRYTALKEQFRDMMLNDSHVVRELRKNPVFATPSSTTYPWHGQSQEGVSDILQSL